MSEHRRFDFRKIKRHAQQLKNDMTESEKLLWYELKELGINIIRIKNEDLTNIEEVKMRIVTFLHAIS